MLKHLLSIKSVNIWADRSLTHLSKLKYWYYLWPLTYSKNRSATPISWPTLSPSNSSNTNGASWDRLRTWWRSSSISSFLLSSPAMSWWTHLPSSSSSQTKRPLSGITTRRIRSCPMARTLPSASSGEKVGYSWWYWSFPTLLKRYIF